MKASTFFLGLATGSLAAAVTVLYSTPKTGDEIRSSIKSTSLQQSFTCAKEQLTKVVQAITTVTNEARNNLPSAVTSIKESIGIWQQSTEPHKEKLEAELAAIQEAIENLEKTITAQKQ